jgi:hypothetical protein
MFLASTNINHRYDPTYRKLLRKSGLSCVIENLLSSKSSDSAKIPPSTMRTWETNVLHLDGVISVGEYSFVRLHHC